MKLLIHARRYKYSYVNFTMNYIPMYTQCCSLLCYSDVYRITLTSHSTVLSTTVDAIKKFLAPCIQGLLDRVANSCDWTATPIKLEPYSNSGGNINMKSIDEGFVLTSRLTMCHRSSLSVPANCCLNGDAPNSYHSHILCYSFIWLSVIQRTAF